MKLSQLNEYIQTLATIGAIIGLIAVVYEVRQSNRIATAQASLDITEQFNSLNAVILSNPRYAKQIQKFKSDEKLSDSDMFEMHLHLNTMGNIWFSGETAYRAGLLPQAAYDGLLYEVRVVTGQLRPEARQYMRQRLEAIPEITERGVGQTLKETLDRLAASD